MKRLEVVFLPRADRDLSSAYDWYRSRDESAALKFRTEVFDVVNRLIESGQAYAPDKSGLRRRRVKKYPYTVLFRITDTNLVTAAVAHHRRRL